jgi:hypothetical protein
MLSSPPEEAMGQRGNSLFQRYKGTSIPYLVLLEGDTADVITVDARNKIPQDKAGIGYVVFLIFFARD